RGADARNGRRRPLCTSRRGAGRGNRHRDPGLMLDWAWIADHLDELAYRIGQHLYLAVIALIVGFAISFAVGIAATRWRAIYLPAAIFADIVFTIPSLALFSAFIAITGIGVLTAEIPLVLYTLVILLRNVVAGFDSVPADVREAADGMGFRRGTSGI